jgi:biopolymer transport protein ExbB
MVPELLSQGGAVMWLLLLIGAVVVGVFVERLLHYHREHINSVDFLNGVRTVLKRDNVVEALSICEATSGPVARLVKAAILARDRGREGIQEAVAQAGLGEVPRLEEKLGLLATVAQISPVLGLFGTVLGMMEVFQVLQDSGVAAPAGALAGGVWKALACSGAGLAVAVPAYASYNYLVSRVRSIVLDMEKSSAEIVSILTDTGPA